MTMEMKPVIALPPKFMAALADAQAANPNGTSLALADAARSLRKIAAKASVQGDYEAQRVVQQHGPTITFNGRLLGEYDTKGGGDDRWFECELWETAGGAYVAVTIAASDEPGREDYVSAVVIEAGGDENERRLAVAEAFKWAQGARTLLTKRLGWKLERVVD